MYPDNLARALSTQLDAETAISSLTMAAFEDWLPRVQASVLPSLTASTELPPDPDQVPSTSGWWELALDQAVIYGLGLIYGHEILSVLTASGQGILTVTDPNTTLSNTALARRARRIVADSLGMKTSEVTELDRRLAELPVIRDIQSQYLAQVRNRMVNTPEVVFRDITVQLDQAVAAGEGSAAQRARVQQFLSPKTGDWAGRAMTVARTESAGAMSHATIKAATLRNEVLGEELEQVWICTLDGVTRSTHWEADGQRVPLGGYFDVGGAQLEFPGDPGGPVEEVANCVPASTRVSGNATAAMMRRFRGMLFEVTTAAGHQFSATANHSVLTRRGWRPVGSLQPGDQLACTADAWSSTGSVDPDVADSEPTIEQCTSAVQFSAGASERVASGFVDLESDIADREVEVHRTDLLLPFGSYTEQLQQLGKLKIQGRHGEVRLADHESSLLRISHSDQGGLPAVPDGDSHAVKSAGDIFAGPPQTLGHLLDGLTGLPHAGDLPVRSTEVGREYFVAVPQLDASVFEASQDDVATDSELLRDEGERHEFGLVQSDDVIDVLGASLLRAGSDGNAGVLEAAGDHLPSDSEVSGDAAGGFTVGVSGDDFIPDLVALSSGSFRWMPITQVIPTLFDGHVYDLTTEEGFYLTEGIISHNCRCRVAVLATDEALPTEQDRHTERGPGDSTVINRAGSQEDEIERRAEEGNIRAREDPAGLGRVASINTEDDMADEETTDIVDVDNTDTDTEVEVEDTGETFRTFTDSIIAVLGTPTDDRRILAADMDFRFREFPLPLMWTKQSSGGHFDAYTVGVIETSRVDGTQVLASGYLLNTDEADEAAGQLSHGVTGPSVDLGDADWIYTNEIGEPITEEMWDEAYESGEELKVYETIISAKLMGVTLVSTPAFSETAMKLDSDRVGKDVAVVASLVAAAARPVDDTYDAGLFADPKLDGPTPVTFDAKTGRIYGHLACFGQCHVGITDQCVVAPRSKTDYAHFHTSPPVLTTDGRLPVGRLTVGTGHAGPRLGARPAAEHYDHTGTCFALVRVGEDEHGIWFSGIPHPTASDEQVRAGLSAPLSGDWRTIAGNLELVAALAVNTPGFPVLVAGASDEADRPTTLVASLGPRAESKRRTASVDPKALALEVVREMRAQDRRNEQAKAVLAAQDRRREARSIIEKTGV